MSTKALMRWLSIFAAIVIAITPLAGVIKTVYAVDACPNGGEWTKVDSDDLSLYPVPGATEYCFKFGSPNSQGCTGGTSDTWPPPGVEKPCGLSHWSYRIPPPTDLCTNLEEIQPTMPDGYEDPDGDGVCTLIPPPEKCEETTPDYGRWSDWEVDPNDASQMIRYRTVIYYDSNDSTVVCGEETESDAMPRPVCEWDSTLYADQEGCQPPPPPPGERLICNANGVEEYIPADAPLPEGATEGECGPDEPPPTEEPWCLLTGETVMIPSDQDPPFGATLGECDPVDPPVVETPKERHVFIPIPCPECGPARQEILPDWGLNDITHNNGEGCFDYFRVKREAIEAGTPNGLAEKIGRWVTLKWGYKCPEMHTIISRVNFDVIDTDGTVYNAQMFSDWNNVNYYFLSVQIRMKWWAETDIYNAGRRLNEFGNPVPIVSAKFKIRGPDGQPIKDYALTLDPNKSFEKLDDIACSVNPNQGFERNIDGRKFVLKWYGMVEDDFIIKFRAMGWDDPVIRKWLEEKYRPAAVGDLVPID